MKEKPIYTICSQCGRHITSKSCKCKTKQYVPTELLCSTCFSPMFSVNGMLLICTNIDCPEFHTLFPKNSNRYYIMYGDTVVTIIQIKNSKISDIPIMESNNQQFQDFYKKLLQKFSRK